MKPEDVLRDLEATTRKAHEARYKQRKEQSGKVAASPAPPVRPLTEDEEAFVQKMLPKLPPVMARAKVPELLGGIVQAGSLRNADSAGTGPKEAWRVGGGKVMYDTESLLRWIAGHYGLTRIKSLYNI